VLKFGEEENEASRLVFLSGVSSTRSQRHGRACPGHLHFRDRSDQISCGHMTSATRVSHFFAMLVFSRCHDIKHDIEAIE
jgi:hypothetical protein